MQQYLGFTAGRWLYWFEYKADSLIAKFKEVGGTVREISRWSRVTAIISALVICIIVRLSWAVNHYRDNAITYKAQRDKNARELKLANAAITDMQMRQRDVAAPKATHEGVSWMLKLKMMLCVMMLPLVVVGCTSKQSVSQCVKLPPPPAWIMQPSPRLADTAERDYFTLRERLITMQNNWKEPRSILMSSADKMLYIDGQLT